ncbi:MAG TPA: hypothetical protein ENJ16_00235 [Planctomycetaceae bacterium]|nr:hypothetical protein [Planctomycetaceae bacterium]
MSESEEAPLRIVLAKVGLDGHDRGIKVVARGLRDAGFHVIYSGLWQKVDDVVRTVADEDADYLGISILSGAHMTLAPRIMQRLRARELGHVGVIMGGIIPAEDIEPLRELGIERVFGPGTPIESIVEYLKESGSRTGPLPPWESLERGERRWLPRWVSAVVRGQELPEIERRLASSPRAPHVVAITGSGGVGKSSLVGKLVDTIRKESVRVGVLACDPQSSVTGGALLGDRVRMPSPAEDEGRYIRSLAAPSGQQALAPRLGPLCRLLGHFGYPLVLIETVGAGQGDTAVRELADTLVLLVQPQTGDEMQWEKAGLLEVADVVVVHKGDLPGADPLVAQLSDLLHLSAGRHVDILKASAARDEGIETLWQTIQKRMSDAAS